MWRPYYVTAQAAAFDSALAGDPGQAPADSLARFVTEVALAMRPTSPFVSERGRGRLLAAVAAESSRRRRSQRGALAPLRTGALAAASLAGGGLVAVSAASGSDPVTVVLDAVSELAPMVAPGGEREEPAAAAETTATVEGSVVSLSDSEFEVQTASGRLLEVSFGEDTQFRDSSGVQVRPAALAAGMRVRVHGALSEGGREVLQARLVEILTGTAAAARPEPTRDPGHEEPTRPAADDPARPADESTPEARPTEPAATRPASSDTAIADETKPAAAAPSNPDPVRPSLTPTPTPEPSRDPAPIETPRPVTPRPAVTSDDATKEPTPTSTPSPTPTPSPRPKATVTAAPPTTWTPVPTDDTSWNYWSDRPYWSDMKADESDADAASANLDAADR
jgi:hypothetical protein